jgi:crotonobetainyl-CoA:carnitine CoA-transferase CaiB-like acyl-CoA transferase
LPGQGPVRAGVAVTDLMAGAFLAQGLLIALLDREVSGQGRWVQTSLVEAGIALLDFQASRWLMDGKVPPQEGNYHPTITPMGLYPTRDSYLNIAATSNANFTKFCQLIARADMVTDPRFATGSLRARNKDALNTLIGEALRERSSREWFDIMVSAGIPCGPVYDIGEVFEDPQVQTLRMARAVTHPRLGNIYLVAQPCEITGFDRSIDSATPDLGEHTNEILRAAGYDQTEVDLFRSRGVI